MYERSQAEPESVRHEVLVASIACFLRPRLYVEIGSQHGGTFRAAAEHAGEAIAVDILPLGHLYADIPRGRFVQSDSVAFLWTLADESVDLCFIDSSHEYEATLAEFAVLAGKMRANGVVLFHDTYPPNEAYTAAPFCGRVFEAIPVLKARYAGFEFATLPAQFGLTIARKNLCQQVLWRNL